MKIVSTLALALLGLTIVSAHAETPAPTPAPVAAEAAKAAPTPEQKARWASCKADAAKLCPTEVAATEKVKGAVGKCLDTHMSELSDPCKASRAEHAAHEAAKAK